MFTQIEGVRTHTENVVSAARRTKQILIIFGSWHKIEVSGRKWLCDTLSVPKIQFYSNKNAVRRNRIERTKANDEGKTNRNE